MATFIKLTALQQTAYGGVDQIPFFASIAHIIRIAESATKSPRYNAYVTLAEHEKSFPVTETPEQILALIQAAKES